MDTGTIALAFLASVIGAALVVTVFVVVLLPRLKDHDSRNR